MKARSVRLRSIEGSRASDSKLLSWLSSQCHSGTPCWIICGAELRMSPPSFRGSCTSLCRLTRKQLAMRVAGIRCSQDPELAGSMRVWVLQLISGRKRAGGRRCLASAKLLAHRGQRAACVPQFRFRGLRLTCTSSCMTLAWYARIPTSLRGDRSNGRTDKERRKKPEGASVPSRMVAHQSWFDTGKG